MSTRAEHVHLAIDYIELGVTDVAAAKEFYRSAFGWSFSDYGPDYAGFKDARGGNEAGGLRLEKRVERGGPLVILFSHELEKTREAVIKAGGSVTKDIFSFPGGRRFQFTDPSGNELAVWSTK